MMRSGGCSPSSAADAASSESAVRTRQPQLRNIPPTLSSTRTSSSITTTNLSLDTSAATAAAICGANCAWAGAEGTITANLDLLADLGRKVDRVVEELTQTL